MAKDGDIRVLLLLNFVLSGLFGTVIVWGLSMIGLATFTIQNALIAVGVLYIVTYLAVLRQ